MPFDLKDLTTVEHTPRRVRFRKSSIFGRARRTIWKRGAETKLRGLPIWSNPFVGSEAEVWRRGYRGDPMPRRVRGPTP